MGEEDGVEDELWDGALGLEPDLGGDVLPFVGELACADYCGDRRGLRRWRRHCKLLSLEYSRWTLSVKTET